MAHKITELPNAELGTMLEEIRRDPSAGMSKIRSLPNEHVLQLFGTFRGDLPRQENDLRSSAYLSLSTVISAIRAPSKGGEPPSEQERNASTQALVSVFTPALDDALQGTSVEPVLSTLAFLIALFQVDPESAIAILQRDDTISSVLDALDIFPAKGSPGAQGTDLRVARAIAALLSQAAGHRASRSLLKNAQDTRCIRWLRGNIGLSDVPLRATSTLALTKLAKGGLQDTEAIGGTNLGGEDDGAGEDETTLVRLMEGVILDGSPQVDLESPAIVDAIEGLAYLSTGSPTKEIIFKHDQMVERLMAIGLAITPSNKKNMQPKLDPRLSIGLHYGIAVIVHNLCAYRPKLGGEEEQVARLKRMTKTPLTNQSKTILEEIKEDPRDSDEAVRKRIGGLLKAGILPVLSGLARSESATTRVITGKIYLAVVEEQANRGAVLQNGGTKALMYIINSSSRSGAELMPDYTSIQALSKLTITSSPVQVFGPDPGAIYDAIGPLTSVLLASLSSLGSAPTLTSGPDNLQRFESLMALTNIASTGAASAARIAATPKLFSALDMLLLDDHPLLRRAATELVCNLVVCDEGFERFVPHPASAPVSPPSTSPPTTPGIVGAPPRPRRRTTKGAAENRLRILLALSDVEDLLTRRAASGALAMLTSDDAICGVIVGMERKKGNTIAILGRLLVEDEGVEDSDSSVGKGKGKVESTPSNPPDLALAHRGIVCLRNLIQLGFSKGGPALLQAFEREGIIEKVEAVVKVAMESGEGKTDGPPSPVVQAAVEFVLGLKSLVHRPGVSS
jgi:protein unc-45